MTSLRTSESLEERIATITMNSSYENLLEAIRRKSLCTIEEMSNLPLELFRFLYLKSKHNVSPSLIVDNAWHCLLLFPAFYQTVCRALLTEDVLIDHDPFGGDNVIAQQKRYARCLEMYKSEFNQTQKRRGLS